MRAAPDTSFDENRNPGNAAGWQCYGPIDVACCQLRAALVAWRNLKEEIDYRRCNRLDEEHLPGEIIYLNHKHRELCGISNLVHVVDAIDLVFGYRRQWVARKMRRSGPVAVSILGLIRDLTKLGQVNGWLFEDPAPFLAYKADLLLREQPLRRCVVQLGYKRYQCARAQDLMVQLQEYHRLSQLNGPYPYDVVAPVAPIDLVQLGMTYQVATADITHHNFDEDIQRVARLPPTHKRNVNLFPFEVNPFPLRK